MWRVCHQVWLLRPVPLEEQTRQLLGAGAILPALHLAELCAGRGATWVQPAFAQAAFLLIHGTTPSLLFGPPHTHAHMIYPFIRSIQFTGMLN